MEASLADEKRTLRRAMTERRDAIDPRERVRCSTEVSRLLLALPEIARATVISGFKAMRSEVDPAEALSATEKRGGTVAFPRVTALVPRLRFHRAAAADFVPGPFGLLEPHERCPEVLWEALDVVLVPGLAFDRQGRRLGYGGGYYDEAATAGGARGGREFLVGVGFSVQIVERCPSGKRDVAMDCVVTDAGILRCEPPRTGVLS